jgi:hypothetical protein
MMRRTIFGAAIGASLGVTVTAFWAIYFWLSPIKINGVIPSVYGIARATQPIAVSLASHSVPVGLSGAFFVNAVTYALVGAAIGVIYAHLRRNSN